MNHKIVHEGERTLYTYKWLKSLIEVAVPGTAAPVSFRNGLHWPQASSGQRVGLMTKKPLRMQHLGAVTAGLRQRAIIIIYINKLLLLLTDLVLGTVDQAVVHVSVCPELQL